MMNEQKWQYARLFYAKNAPADKFQWNVEHDVNGTYEIHHGDERTFLELLDSYGRTGWEAVGTLPSPVEGVLLKRAKP